MNVDSFAQDAIISGQVKTSAGDPLVGAAVLVKGTKNGTITDANGGAYTTYVQVVKLPLG